MKCQTFKKQLSAFQDGALSHEKIGAMRSHLRSCDQCRKLYRESEAILNMLTMLPEPEPQPFFYTRLKGRMEQIPDTERHWIQKAFLPAMTTAMLTLGIVLGSMAGRFSDTTLQPEHDLFDSLPLEDLNILTEDAYTTGYFDLSGVYGGAE